MPLPATSQRPQAGTHRPFEERIMSEFFRSGAIMLMGLTVMAAGVAVVFYG
jgi:hypothetical protein